MTGGIKVIRQQLFDGFASSCIQQAIRNCSSGPMTLGSPAAGWRAYDQQSREERSPKQHSHPYPLNPFATTYTSRDRDREAAGLRIDTFSNEVRSCFR